MRNLGIASILFVIAGSLLIACSGGAGAGSYGDEAVWDALESNEQPEVIRALHQCGGPPAGNDCITEVMRDAGASPAAVDFFTETGWFLVRIRELGAVDVGTVLLPWRANANQQYVALNGGPSVVFVEEEGAVVDMKSDSHYGELVAAVKPATPDAVDIFAADNVFDSQIERQGGGARLFFQYDIVNGCHACGTGYRARVALDFSDDGEYLGPQLIALCRTPNAPFALVGVDACPAVAP